MLCYVYTWHVNLRDFLSAELPAMTPADKKQLAMVSAAHGTLKEKASLGEIGPEIQEQLDQLLLALNSRNFPAANAIQMVRLASSFVTLLIILCEVIC